jgi:hypothetical protein
VTDDLTEVWAAYRTLVSDPAATPEEIAAFLAAVGLRFSFEALAEVRRAVESFLTDHEQPSPDDGDPDLMRYWKG